jgi:hypothetical protein
MSAFWTDILTVRSNAIKKDHLTIGIEHGEGELKAKRASKYGTDVYRYEYVKILPG